LTLGGQGGGAARFLFDAKSEGDFVAAEKWFELTPAEFRLLNPNTLTCPVFRSERDAALTKKLYRVAPVMIAEGPPEVNPWGIRFMTMIHMANDSGLFFDAPAPGRLPLYEAKMMHQFDHRWATYSAGGSGEVACTQKQDPNFSVIPRYWLEAEEVEVRLQEKSWEHGWFMGWRDIALRSVERTVIATVVPRVAVAHTMPLFMTNQSTELSAALLGNLLSLTLDFVARVKVGGTHLTYGYLKQFPILPPNRYTKDDLAFIVPRILELTYTAHDLKPWAEDLGYEGPPFPWNPERRAKLGAELDAYYAHLYKLTRDELRYILDPSDIMGKEYPSETFRVLKNNEMREFGEYRTQRLVLEAWDTLQGNVEHECLSVLEANAIPT
jgi:hypothetical protein